MFQAGSRHVLYLMVLIAVLGVTSMGVTDFALSQEIDAKIYQALKYRHIGPQGNRVIAVAGVPGDPSICYAGAASGGIFKSTDGGVHWSPIFDEYPVSSIGSLAIAPSDPNIIWAGTGETFIRSNISQGMGVYRSMDAGKTWKLMGLEKTGRIGRILIDPRDPNVVFAAAMGHCYGPQQERGVYRTTDGGESWERVLFVDEDTGCSDLIMDPNNPRNLVAGMWPMLIRTWGRWSGGPGGGIYVSGDGGSTWKPIEGHGLPKSPVGKVALAMSPSNSNRIYALIETDDGVLWRSDDGGENWKLINRDHTLTQRPHYYSRLGVNVADHNEVYFLATRYSVSLDGGETSKPASPSPGGDNHDIWVDPEMPDRIMVGNDGGVRISLNRGKTWFRPHLPIAQMYHVAVDDQIPYFVYGNRQDGPSARGPSNSLTGGSIPSSRWHSVGGCECGFAIPDPVDNNIVWSGCYEGLLDRFDLRTGHSRAVNVWPEDPLSWPASEVKYRFQWNFPIAISPHDHNIVYVGSQHVHQTTDGGHSWTTVSPDLSTNDGSKQETTGGITPDDASPTYACTLFALAESPIRAGLIWAGTNDGLVHVTRDGGANWTNVSDNIPNLIPWGTVSNIEPSRYDAGTCYFTMDYHQVNNRNPYVFKTTDYGQTWRMISAGVPKSELSYAHCVREDPVRKGLLYLGTENALYVSFDDGGSWNPLQNNLPHAPVHWIEVQERFNDLVVATYGRGFWILDDVTPLQTLTTEVTDAEVHLHQPRPAYRFRNVATPMGHPDDQSVGQNPPPGASIHYYLKSAPEGEVKLTILDKEGRTVRTYQAGGGAADEQADEQASRRRGGSSSRLTRDAGINRFWWDLRYDRTDQIRLRTSPIGAPHIGVGPKGYRTIGRRISLLAAPGRYTVRLTVDGKDYTQELTVLKDPASSGSEENIQTQTRTLLEIRDHINAAVGMVNSIERVRKQIYALNGLLQGNGQPVIAAGKELDKKLIELEEHLIQMKLTGGNAGQDTLRWPAKLTTRLATLANGIGKSDFPPTTQQMEVHQLFGERLSGHQRRFDELIEKDLAQYNKMLRDENIGNIIVTNKQ